MYPCTLIGIPKMIHMNELNVLFGCAGSSVPFLEKAQVQSSKETYLNHVVTDGKPRTEPLTSL